MRPHRPASTRNSVCPVFLPDPARNLPAKVQDAGHSSSQPETTAAGSSPKPTISRCGGTDSHILHGSNSIAGASSCQAANRRVAVLGELVWHRKSDQLRDSCQTISVPATARWIPASKNPRRQFMAPRLRRAHKSNQNWFDSWRREIAGQAAIRCLTNAFE